MKAIYLAFLLFLSSIGISAQEVANSSNNSGVTVLQKEWYMEVNNPAFEKSPFAPIDDMQQVNQTRRAVQRQNAVRARRGLPPLRTPNNTPQQQSNSSENAESPNIYTYKTKIKNTGEKTIKAVIWEYVFFEPGTQKEVGRVMFVSEGKISPGKTKDLKMSSLSPPSNTINVKDTGKKLRDQYTGEVVIQSIEYDDGTTWDANETAPVAN